MLRPQRRRAHDAARRAPSTAAAHRLRRHRRGRVKLERAYREWQERDELFAASVIWDLAWIELWAGTLGDRERPRRACARDQPPVRRRPESELHPDRVDRRAPRRSSTTRGRKRNRPEAVRGADRVPSAPPPGGAGNRRSLAGRRGDGRRAPRKGGQQAQALGWRARRAPLDAGLVEALLSSTDVDEAVRCSSGGNRRGRVGNDWVLAPVTRCRGLVALRGGRRRGVTLLEEAVARHEALGDTSDAPARYSRWARPSACTAKAGRPGGDRGRARRVRGPRCGDLGRERSRDELGRISGRTREDDLTAAERRVAALVAEGRTNHEVATRLPAEPDSRRPSYADVRQARCALAHRARRAKVQTF